MGLGNYLTLKGTCVSDQRQYKEGISHLKNKWEKLSLKNIFIYFYLHINFLLTFKSFMNKVKDKDSMHSIHGYILFLGFFPYKVKQKMLFFGNHCCA